MNNSITTEQLALMLGVTPRRVQQLSEKQVNENDEMPLFERDAAGNFDPFECVPVYIASIKKNDHSERKIEAEATLAEMKAADACLLYTSDAADE